MMMFCLVSVWPSPSRPIENIERFLCPLSVFPYDIWQYQLAFSLLRMIFLFLLTIAFDAGSVKIFSTIQDCLLSSILYLLSCSQSKGSRSIDLIIASLEEIIFSFQPSSHIVFHIQMDDMYFV